MITFLMIVAITAYFIIGIVTAFVVDETDDSTSTVICLMAWPLLLPVMAGMWVGNKIRNLISK